MPKSLKKPLGGTRAGQPVRPVRPVRIDTVKVAAHAWQLQTAKARFSELFRLARTEGPQLITRQGREGVVMMPVEQFNQLVIRSHQPKSLVQFFRESPFVGVKLDLERDKDPGRDVGL